MNPKSFLLPFLCLALSLSAVAGRDARTWRSADGATVTGEFEGLAGEKVTIRRSPDGRRFTFPLERLSEEDQAYAQHAAALREFRMRASLAKSDTDRKTRQTGTKRVAVPLPNGGTTYEERAIIEKYTLSSKTLKIEASSGGGEIEVGIEVYFLVRKGGVMSVFENQSKKISAGEVPTVLEFSSKRIEDFYGWAVLAHEGKTGAVIASQGSSYPVEQHVLDLKQAGER